MGVFAFRPATDEAVHLKEAETAGNVNDLLLPPVTCSILKVKSRLSSIGILNTDLISRILSLTHIT